MSRVEEWHAYTFHCPLDAVLITTDSTTLQTLSTDSTAKAREGSDYVIASYVAILNVQH